MYAYRAALARVIDGDTVELVVDLGFRMTVRDRFRLADIDAPEHDAGATNYLQHLFDSIPGPYEIRTYKPDKYGRWLVTVMTPDGSSLNEKMVQAGRAKPYFGGHK